MIRSQWMLASVVALASGAWACSGADDTTAREARLDGDQVTVTGCLTAAPDGGAYVLTANRNALTSGALYSGDGEVPTYTYELVPGSADLTPHVGREVAITGAIDDDVKDEVEVDDEKTTTEPETQVGDDKVTPAIETDTEMEIQVRRLHVASVQATGNSCALARGQ